MLSTMRFTLAGSPGEGLPVSLRIRFAAGERPHLFWLSRCEVSSRSDSTFKILSKSLADGTIEVIVIEEPSRGRRRPLAQVELPPETPAGWLTRWVDMVSNELGRGFHRYDLRTVDSADEWRAVAAKLGWTRSGKAAR